LDGAASFKSVQGVAGRNGPLRMGDADTLFGCGVGRMAFCMAREHR